MTQYNTFSIKLSNSQFNKLKSEIENGTEVTLNLSSNMIGSSDDEINLTNKLLLTNAQVWRLRKTFANSLSANIIRRISRQTFSTITKNWLVFNEKCTETVS